MESWSAGLPLRSSTPKRDPHRAPRIEDIFDPSALCFQDEQLRGKPRGKIFMRIFSKVVTLQCFNWGSSPKFAWITAKNMRE